MLIIKPSLYYREWIVSHYNLITSNRVCFEFENAASSYHEEILVRELVHMFHPQNKIHYLMNEVHYPDSV